MAAEDRERDQARSDNARHKRKEQLKRWLGSDTDRESERPRTKQLRVKFAEGAVFLAACSSGDREEVEKLLLQGADINYTNVDGLTALHQACIDENLDMVTFLVEHGANINQPDNEGWTALHAAASCGFMEIAEYLIKQRANVAAVNSEGELPIDIAQGEAMEKLLKDVIKKQGIDVEVARREEEQRMVQDARQWLNRGKIQDIRHPKTGASALHVAAAKGYLEVIKLLIQAGFDVNSLDNDGWTPLHAASHWGKEEVCKLLVENLCNMQAINKVGQTAFDVADENLLEMLEELQKKQAVMKMEKEKQAKMDASLIELSNASQQLPTRTRRTSISRMSSKDKISMHEKERKTLESVMLEHVNDDEDRKKLNGSSSEEEMPNEAKSEAEKTKARLNMNNLSTKLGMTDSILPSSTAPSGTNKRFDFITPLLPFCQPSDPTSWRQGLRKTGIVLVPQRGQRAAFTGPPAKTAAQDEEKKEQQSPAAWRTALRKTGSYGALNNLQPPQEEQKGKEVGIIRSASSPKLTLAETKEKEKEPRLARVPPTPTRKLFTIGDANEDKTSDSTVPLSRSTSYKGQREDDSGNPLISLTRGSSYTRRQTELESSKRDKDLNNTIPSSAGISTAAVSGYPKSHFFLRTIGRSYSAQDFTARSRTLSSVASNNNVTNSDSASTNIIIFKSSSFGRRQESLVSSSAPGSVNTVSSSGFSTNPANSRALTMGSSAASTATSDTSRSMTRNQVGNGTDKESNPTTQSNGSGTEIRERRRSYLTPVRDEEAEAQRKARSRHARQSRRSTQGVTLTDLQEAEKTIGLRRDKKTAEQEKDKEKEKEEKEAEAKDAASKYRYSRTSQDEEKNWRSRLANLQKADLLGLTSSTDSNRSSVPAYTCHNAVEPLDNKELEKAKEEEKESDDSSFKRSGTRDRRRPRGKRRSTGVHSISQDDDNDQDNSGDDVVESEKRQIDYLTRGYTSGSSQGHLANKEGFSYSDTSLQPTQIGQGEIETEKRGYRKLYEELQRKNVQLRDQLQEVQMQIAQTKLELEKATQMQERFADRTVHLEMEKKERKALERRISELEEELKVLTDLRADNQRLKDENGALIRVISKLSK
ncbi:protein phosphatase 1 regulatory subunit 12A-like isoform X1 [Chiloscyllium plagiosum]|uniref:protein phosphatase 1 regulatory subunit 12A-like isoform X1 n=1 Tax=Chiloscyllium plagiosum TaxID=36176 RepID=UPI001CB82F66|nr:protein phosphatase 1 regulatory subunit 12A-like isoform X1 [Chiloscyllium plagiosum]